MNKTAQTVFLLGVVIAVGGVGWIVGGGVAVATVSPVTGSDEEPQPVDDDMHHFMEYVFEPNYLRLKAAMADNSQDKAVWKAIKGDSLTLAECTNLLLSRGPEKDAAQWQQHAVAVRTHGSQLYQAARQSDYPAARAAYVTMLKNCNACHQQFADGEHQLEP